MSSALSEAPSLRDRLNDPERCQHGYKLTWKNCPMCKREGVVLKHGTPLRAVYGALLLAEAEGRREPCRECGGFVHRSFLAEAHEVLNVLGVG